MLEIGVPKGDRSLSERAPCVTDDGVESGRKKTTRKALAAQQLRENFSAVCFPQRSFQPRFNPRRRIPFQTAREFVLHLGFKRVHASSEALPKYHPVYRCVYSEAAGFTAHFISDQSVASMITNQEVSTEY